ncbi:MAG: EAL domain-containing protein [Acholeplasmatales bacterium]|nr:EAL domain-containing protein [Acholeplasmatales bacterium]
MRTISFLELNLGLPHIIAFFALAAIVVVAVLAFRHNYRQQMRVTQYMDLETDVYNRLGIIRYIKLNSKKFKNPTLVSIHIVNITNLYSTTIKDKHKMMVSITDCFMKGLNNIELVGRVTNSQFLTILDGRSKDEVKDYCRKVEERLNHLNIIDYGSYNFIVEFGVNDVTGISDVTFAVDATLAIFDFSTTSDGNIYYYSQSVAMAMQNYQLINQNKDSALTNHQFQAYIQPKIDFRTGVVIGGEILARWLDSNGNIMYNPGEFIPVFESNGFVRKLDLEMFNQGCELAGLLVSRGYHDIVISVNLSKVNFESKTLLEDISAIIARYGIQPKNIEIEITENAIMQSAAFVSQNIMKLRNMGFHLAMDDFGKEYSSLGSLADNPFDTIKMDMVFFKNGLSTEKEKTIAKNVINLLNKLNVNVVCEGISNKDTLDILATISRDVIIQGYCFSKPIPKNNFEAFLQTVFTLDYPDIPVQKVAVAKPQGGVQPQAAPQAQSDVSPSELELIKMQLDQMRQEMAADKISRVQAEAQKPKEAKSDEDDEKRKQEIEQAATIKMLQQEVERLKNQPQQQPIQPQPAYAQPTYVQPVMGMGMGTPIVVDSHQSEEIRRLREEIENLKKSQQSSPRDEKSQLEEELASLKAQLAAQSKPCVEPAARVVTPIVPPLDDIDDEQSEDEEVSKNFQEKVRDADEEMQGLYNFVKNEFLKYANVTCDIIKSYEKFYYNRRIIGKIYIGKSSIKVLLPLNSSDYSQAQYPHKDLSDKKAHMQTPFAFVVKSTLSKKRLSALVADVMAAHDIVENPNYKPTNHAYKFKYYTRED